MMNQKAQRKADSEVLSRRAVQVQRGAARAAVLGVNDGLVSTLCIVLAVAGAGGSQAAVQLAGFAGLLAGAVSMAAGEWISVKAQVELFQGILQDLKTTIKSNRELLIEQLTAVFKNNGLKTDTAALAAKELGSNDKNLHLAYANRVIGLNPDELGSPWAAAISSFLLFVAGSVVALWPWFLFGGEAAIWSSIVSTAVGGLVSGAYVAYSSGKNMIYGAARQLLIVVLAASVTYGVGYLFGVSVS